MFVTFCFPQGKGEGRGRLPLLEMVGGVVVEGEQALVGEERLATVSKLVPAVSDPGCAPPQKGRRATPQKGRRATKANTLPSGRVSQ